MDSALDILICETVRVSEVAYLFGLKYISYTLFWRSGAGWLVDVDLRLRLNGAFQ